MKPTIRVTQLEAFRRFMANGDRSRYEITEESLIDSITGEFVGNEYTRIGTAFHQIVEEGVPSTTKIAPPTKRKFTFNRKPQTEALPIGLSLMVDDKEVVFDVDQFQVALDYREEHPCAYHEVRLFHDFGDAVVTGCADMIDGTAIRDIKTKYSLISDADYIDSAQWRFYLDIFDGDTFCFDLFPFEGYDKEKHGYDVRCLPLVRHLPTITCYRYPKMHDDNLRLLDDFLTWADARNLTQYLNYNG